MSVAVAEGDIFLTPAQAVGLGLNAAGRLDVSPFFTTLSDRYPVFVSEYRRYGRSRRLAPGDIWIWRESQPWLVGMVVRDTPHGPARLRYLESALLNLYKTWELEGLRSLALLPFTDSLDWPAAQELIEFYLGRSALAISIYGADSAR